MRKYLLPIILLFVAFHCMAQVKNKDDKNFNFTGIPILGYNRTVEFSAGAMLNGFYKIDRRDAVSPSSSTSAIGIYTTNGSYFAAVVQQFFLKQDNWRVKLIGGFGNANLQVYHEFDQAGQYINYTTLISVIALDLKRKVYKNVFAGISGALEKANTTFDFEDAVTGENVEDGQVLNNVGINLLFDSRDNINYPLKGLQINLNSQFYQKWMGDDSTFIRLELSYNYYFNFKSEKRVMLFRYYSKMSFAEVPFQGKNVVRGDDIRGYSKGKYRDNQVSCYQVEYRHGFENRFGFVAFAGVAVAIPDFFGYFNTTYLPGAGVGVRYKILKKEKINIGIDVAAGIDDWSLTFRVGEAFSR